MWFHDREWRDLPKAQSSLAMYHQAGWSHPTKIILTLWERWYRLKPFRNIKNRQSVSLWHVSLVKGQYHQLEQELYRRLCMSWLLPGVLRENDFHMGYFRRKTSIWWLLMLTGCKGGLYGFTLWTSSWRHQRGSVWSRPIHSCSSILCVQINPVRLRNFWERVRKG